MSKTPHEHFAAVNAQDTPELERNLEAARFWQMRDIDAGDYDPVVETFIETAEDALRFRDAAYMLDSPEDTPVKRISLLSRYVKHPVYFQEILETYVRDKAGLVGMSEEEKKELESAHYLIDKINSGKFPDQPWERSGSLGKVGYISYYSSRVMTDREGNDFNMRQTDPEGKVNRLVFYEQIGIKPDQVLSPALGATSDVVAIGSGDRLVYDKQSKRLMPEQNDGHADGWLITQPELAQSLAGVGFVADCPMASLVFTREDKAGRSDIVASGMMHMGWKNVGAGIDLTMAKLIQEQGLEDATLHVNISPGARFGLKLPKELLVRKSVGRAQFGEAHRSDMQRYGVKDVAGEMVEYDSVLGAARLIQMHLGAKPENIFVSDRCTISDPSAHSYRRDKGVMENRPEAGRFAALTVPDFASNDEFMRSELFGDDGRKTEGIMHKISDDSATVVYQVR